MKRRDLLFAAAGALATYVSGCVAAARRSDASSDSLNEGRRYRDDGERRRNDPRPPPNQGGERGAIRLQPGATWNDFLGAFSRVPPGGTIYLPNGNIDQTSALLIDKSVKILGSGPLSKVTLVRNVAMFGSGMQFCITSQTPGVLVNGVTLADFAIEQIRGPVTRVLGIAIQGRTRNIRCQNLHFKSMTSDCFITRDFTAPVTGEGIDGVYISDCVADGWWESFVEHRQGSLRNFYLVNCKGTTNSANPNTASSRPSGVFLNLEETKWPGLIENYHVLDNSFVANLGPDLGKPTVAFNNSIGMAVRVNQSPDHRYHNIHIRGNLFEGFHYGLNHFKTQTTGGSKLFPGIARHFITGNTWKRCGSTGSAGIGGIVDLNISGAADDVVVFADNDIHRKLPAHNAIKATPKNVKLILEPPNRIH